MDAQELRNLQEAYREVVMNEGLGGVRNQDDYEEIERKREEVRDEHLRKYKSGELPFQKQKKADQAQEFLKKHPRKKRTQKEQVDLYDIILSHLLDEGYAETQEAAEVMMVNMSEEWRYEIIEAFVDPEEGEAPSGRSPLENVSYHPKKKVRRKAMGAFAHQMGKEYGGKWKAKYKDPTG